MGAHVRNLKKTKRLISIAYARFSRLYSNNHNQIKMPFLVSQKVLMMIKAPTLNFAGTHLAPQVK